MAAGDRASPVFGRRAHKTEQIVISTDGARRMCAMGGIPVVAAEGKDEGEGAPLDAYSSQLGRSLGR